jgi:D-beta-D-heptose 7-phosphate kinase / D-beta-D-heptose 1-phosphate adenosyltransferase
MAVSPALGRLIESFAQRRVLVIGEAMLDCYLHGVTERLCREAPVPIVDVVRRVEVPGGAANTAVNARALGADVTLLSLVGDDAEASMLCGRLEAQGVRTTALLRNRGRRTLTKQRLLAGGHMLVRFDHGSTGALGEAAERALAARAVELAAVHDVILVSDYGYGILGPRVIGALADGQARQGRVIVVDSKSLAAYHGVGVTAVKPNFAEAVALLGGAGPGDADERAELIAAQGRRLLETTGARIAAVTLDTEGALFFERGRAP